MTTETHDFSFEESLKELEGLVEKMRKGDVPLDESLKMFEKGIQLVRKCHHQLEATEKKVEVLVRQTSGDWETKEFKAE